ncbi:MAG: hydrogenase/urease maturation nickel metallochaperone HypA [Rhodospirillales bacterium]|nr:hydrogenase/urease maturation nickel metallochaperone HypA [Rhodospirillales bacterium]
MHETGIVRNLIRQLEQAVLDSGATGVSAVSVRLGALSLFSPSHFREHFDEEAIGTKAEKATLSILTSDDISAPHAQDVMIESISLEVPEETG